MSSENQESQGKSRITSSASGVLFVAIVVLLVYLLFDAGLVQRLLFGDAVTPDPNASNNETRFRIHPNANEPTVEIGQRTVVNIGDVTDTTKPDTSSSPRIFTDQWGKEMMLVEGGPFTLGSLEFEDARIFEPSRAMIRLRLDAFYMDKTEVTANEFAEFIKAGGYYERKYWSTEGWNYIKSQDVPVDAPRPLLVKYDPTRPLTKISVEDGEFTSGAPREGVKILRVYMNPSLASVYTMSFSIVGLSYYEAEAYAKWAGKRLPTEWEWEKAARGPSDHRPYVWGDAAPSRAEPTEGSPSSYKETNYGGHTLARPYAPGSFPADVSPYGILDLAGNVNEWCATVYARNLYQDIQKAQGIVFGMTSMKEATRELVCVRGGAYNDSELSAMNLSYRRRAIASDLAQWRGFRCVLDASKARN